jgi:hypothetical protein
VAQAHLNLLPLKYLFILAMATYVVFSGGHCALLQVASRCKNVFFSLRYCWRYLFYVPGIFDPEPGYLNQYIDGLQIGRLRFISRQGQDGLVAGFPPRRPGFIPGAGHVGFCDGQKWR